MKSESARAGWGIRHVAPLRQNTACIPDRTLHLQGPVSFCRLFFVPLRRKNPRYEKRYSLRRAGLGIVGDCQSVHQAGAELRFLADEFRGPALHRCRNHSLRLHLAPRHVARDHAAPEAFRQPDPDQYVHGLYGLLFRCRFRQRGHQFDRHGTHPADQCAAGAPRGQQRPSEPLQGREPCSEPRGTAADRRHGQRRCAARLARHRGYRPAAGLHPVPGLLRDFGFGGQGQGRPDLPECRADVLRRPADLRRGHRGGGFPPLLGQACRVLCESRRAGLHFGLRLQFLVHGPAHRGYESQRHQYVPPDQSRPGGRAELGHAARRIPVAGMAVIVSSLVIYFRGEAIVRRWRLRRH